MNEIVTVSESRTVTAHGIFNNITKFHAYKISVQERPYLTIHPDERNNPVIIRNGVAYLNLDAKDNNGNPMVSITHTAKRRVEYKEET